MIGRPVYSYTVGSLVCWVVAMVSVSMFVVSSVAPIPEFKECVPLGIVNWRMWV